MNTLEKLRHLGTGIAIDDFGTGYSSLKYLTQYQVNRLKLAPEFVFRVTIDYRNAAVVRAAIRLANELGLEAIAEGVETEAQARFLMGAGCGARGQSHRVVARRADRAPGRPIAPADLGRLTRPSSRPRVRDRCREVHRSGGDCAWSDAGHRSERAPAWGP